MVRTCETDARPLGTFERYLSLWVAVCMAAGVALGQAVPFLFQAVAGLEYAGVNAVMAVLIWVMIFPMMVNVDLTSVKEVVKNPKAFAVSFVVTWLVMPFGMTALAVFFLQHVFAGFIPPEDAKQYVSGLILLGAAPCTAMVFVWSRLVNGDPNYTLVQVALNNVILICAYAPLASFLGSVEIF